MRNFPRFALQALELLVWTVAFTMLLSPALILVILGSWPHSP